MEEEGEEIKKQRRKTWKNKRKIKRGYNERKVDRKRRKPLEDLDNDATESCLDGKWNIFNKSQL